MKLGMLRIHVSQFACSHVPSRLEGIETELMHLLLHSLLTCSHVPSRLEGIETKVQEFFNFFILVSSHVPSRLEGIETKDLHLFAIPVNSSHVPSRLEGIETPVQLPEYCAGNLSVHMCLPVWRELKPNTV